DEDEARSSRTTLLALRSRGPALGVVFATGAIRPLAARAASALGPGRPLRTLGLRWRRLTLGARAATPRSALAACPAPVFEALGPEAQRRRGDADDVLAALHDHRHRGGHAGHQLQVVVGDADDGVVGDEVLVRDRL